MTFESLFDTFIPPQHFAKLKEAIAVLDIENMVLTIVPGMTYAREPEEVGLSEDKEGSQLLVDWVRLALETVMMQRRSIEMIMTILSPIYGKDLQQPASALVELFSIYVLARKPHTAPLQKFDSHLQ